MLAIMSRSGATILRMSMRERFIWNSSPSCASVGALRMSSSRVSILSSNSERTGKKLSTSAADDEIHDDELGRGDRVRADGARSHSRTCGHRRAVAPVHRDDVAVGPEAVDLGLARVVGVGATGHEVDEVVVGVDARPLVEALGRLDGQVVELERGWPGRSLTRAVRGAVVVEVEPEELGPGQRRQHVLHRGGRVVAVLAQGPVQHGVTVSPRPAGARVDDASGETAGSNERRQRRLVRRAASTPAMACASSRAE